MKRIEEKEDDELRIIGTKIPVNVPEEPRWPWLKWTLAVACIVMAILIIIGLSRRTSGTDSQPEEQVESAYEDLIVPAPQIPLEPFGTAESSDGTAWTERIDMTINDIPLAIYIPHNAKASLMVGTPSKDSKDIILATQAADIRADNGKIVGAFVMKGEPLAWGLSKRGYCGIIDGEVTVGVADNSPLFEQATETGGYFFRQYPLVDNRKLVDNEPKNKSVRKALCQRAGQTLLIMSCTPESFHDFAQALVDLGVDNAIYVVGSEYSYGFYRDKGGEVLTFAEYPRRTHKFDNYILWSKAE